jgi:hypothetical protein
MAFEERSGTKPASSALTPYSLDKRVLFLRHLDAWARSAAIRIVRAAVEAVRHAVTVAVSASMTVVPAAVMAVVPIPDDATRRRLDNDDHARAIATVSVMRLRLHGRAQGDQRGDGCSSKGES